MDFTKQNAPVKDKIPSFMLCKHQEDTKTEKSGREGLKYLAKAEFKPEFHKKLLEGQKYEATVKVDGTCCLIGKDSSGKVCILKRRDIKPYRKKPQKIPDTWVQTGADGGKHIIGFMPIEDGDKWHYDAHPVQDENVKGVKRYDTSKIRVLTIAECGKKLEYQIVDIETLDGKSVELMGPKFQANPHKLEHHCVMVHGLIKLSDCPDLHKIAQDDTPLLLTNWVQDTLSSNFIEGIVMHMEDGSMFKIHCHHMNMKWGDTKPLIEFPL